VLVCFRFTGDEAKDINQKLSASEILEKIKSDAKKRKERLSGIPVLLDESQPEDQHVKKDSKSPKSEKKRQKKFEKDSVDDSINKTDIVLSDTIEDNKSRKRKKKQSESNQAVSEIDNKKDDESFLSFEHDSSNVKKRKKRKTETPKDAQTNDTSCSDLDTSDIALPLVKNSDITDLQETEEANESEAPTPRKYGNTEIGGFTVIGDIRPAKVEKVLKFTTTVSLLKSVFKC